MPLLNLLLAQHRPQQSLLECQAAHIPSAEARAEQRPHLLLAPVLAPILPAAGSQVLNLPIKRTSQRSAVCAHYTTLRLQNQANWLFPKETSSESLTRSTRIGGAESYVARPVFSQSTTLCVSKLCPFRSTFVQRSHPPLVVAITPLDRKSSRILHLQT